MEELNLSLFQSAFDHAAIGMALVALTGRCLKVNRSLCEFLGYSEVELLKLGFQDITHPDDLEREFPFLHALLQGERHSFQLEKRYIHRTGRVLWGLLSVSLGHDRQGRPECFVSQVQDITTRKEAEQDRDTLMSLPLVFQCVVGADGFARRVSPSFTQTFGYSADELQGRPCVEFFHPEDRATTTAEIGKLIGGGETRYFQNRFRCKSGPYRWVLWCGIGVPDRGVFYAIGTDITPLKESEEKAAQMLDEKEDLIERLQQSASAIRKLQEQLITVCAWTKRIRYNGEWMSADKFLSDHLHFNLTHGISEEAIAKLIRSAGD